MSETQKDIDYDLWCLLNQARDTLLMARKNELIQYGVSAIESQALNIMAEIGESIAPAELSRRMFRRHNTVTSLLGRMERNGLVTRTPDPKKSNNWKIALTEKGRIAHGHSLKREALHLAMSDLSDEKKAELFNILKGIRDNALKQLASQPTITSP